MVPPQPGHCIQPSWHVAVYAQVVLTHAVVNHIGIQQRVPGPVLQQNILFSDVDGSRYMMVPAYQTILAHKPEIPGIYSCLPSALAAQTSDSSAS